MQSSLDFTAAEVHRENRELNQRHHDDNLPHFAKQDKRVYEMLKEGRRLTTTEALKEGIGDLRRRIKTLRDAGVKVLDEWAKDGGGKETRFKEYFI